MKVKMYQVPVTEMFAVRAQVIMAGSNPDGVSGEGIPGGGEDDGGIFD